MKTMSKLVILILAGAVVLGCSTSRELTQARQSYSEALRDPMVVRNGATALNDAHNALDQAQEAKTWEKQINYAYIAQRNVEIARLQAAQAQSQTELAQLQDRTDRLSASLQQQEAAAQPRAYRSQRDEMMLQPGEPHFGFDEARLPEAAKPELERVSAYLHENKDHRVLVEGFTDNIGSEAYNQQLGQRRAEAVARVLQADGISPERIIIRSMGENFPVAGNDTASGRQQNRRAEITILNADQNPDDVGKKGGGM